MAKDFDDLGCDKTCAMLLVSGDNIEAEEFTRLFQLIPTETRKAGDCTGWRICSDGRLASRSAEEHILWVLDQISGKEAVVKGLLARGCQVDIYCEWKLHAKCEQGGPLLKPDVLKRVSNFGLNLIFGFSS